jgi:hypothetical protein
MLSAGLKEEGVAAFLAVMTKAMNHKSKPACLGDA